MLMSHRIKKLSVKFNSSHLRALTLFHHLSESCTRRENVDEKNHSILRINGNDVDVTIESNMKFMIHSMSITNFPRSLWSLINSNKTLNTSSPHCLSTHFDSWNNIRSNAKYWADVLLLCLHQSHQPLSNFKTIRMKKTIEWDTRNNCLDFSCFFPANFTHSEITRDTEFVCVTQVSFTSFFTQRGIMCMFMRVNCSEGSQFEFSFPSAQPTHQAKEWKEN